MKNFLFFTLITFIIGVSNVTAQSDNCPSATILSLNNGSGCATGTTVGATNNGYTYNAPCNTGVLNDVWYTYVTTGSQNDFSVIPLGMQDAQIVIYTGGCPSAGGVLETCDLAAGTATLNMSYGIPAGTQVWVGIMSGSAIEGQFDFCVDSYNPPVSGGNGCAGALPVCDGTYVTDMTSITSSGTFPSCFFGAVNQDVWFTFDVLQAGTFEWSAIPTGASTGVELDWALYDISGGCPGLEVDCNYNYDGGNNAANGQTPGGTGEFNPPSFLGVGTYAIVVDFFSNTGVGTLDFTVGNGGSALIAPVADFTVNPAGPTCAASVTVNITDNSVGVPTWDFGDGTTYTGNNPPAHTYTNPGVYAITATIAGQCPQTFTQFVELYGPLGSSSTFVDETCVGDCDGSISVTPTGGSGNYSYTWNPNISTGPTANGLCTGNYSITIDDAVCGTSVVENVTIGTSTTGACCSMDNLTMSVTNCYTNGGFLEFDMQGTLTFTSPPTTGTLTITDCYGAQQVFNAPFTSPFNFTQTNMPQTGALCSFTAEFSADPSCTITGDLQSPPPITGFSSNCVIGGGAVDGTIDFDDTYTSGTLVISIDDGTNVINDVITLPATSPQNWSVGGLDPAANPYTISYYFSDFPGCAQTQTINCGCSADAGTYQATLTGNGTTNFVLCEGDIIDINSDLNFQHPDDVGPIGGTPYVPGIAWLIYSCPPTPGVDPTVDPCFVGVFNSTGNGDMSDLNDLTVINNFPPGTFTNNEVFFAAMTMYNFPNLVFNTNCWDISAPVSVTYLPPIVSSFVEDCQAGTVTVTLNGGHPEIFGSNFTVSNLAPGSANFQSTTTGNGGTIVIENLVDGDMYSFDVVDQNGCPHTITGGPFVGPDDATIDPAGPFCPGDPIFQMTAADPGGTWSGPGVNASGQFNPATAGVGVHTITYTIPGTCGDTDTEDVTVTALADATIDPAGPYCESDAATTLTAATAGGTWAGPGITDVNAGTFDPSVAGPGTHTITYTIAGSCGNSDTEDFVVIAEPIAGTPGNIAVCNSDPAVDLFNLIGGAPQTGGIWTGPSALANGDQGTFDPATNTAGTYTYTVSGAPTCPDATVDVVVSITAQLDATITPVADVCESDLPFNLTGADPGGTWTGTGITDANAGTFDPSVAGAGTHTITYTLGGGCGDVQTTDITVIAPPDAGTDGAVTYCDIDPADNLITHLGGTPDAGGTWSGPSALANGDQGTFDPASNLAGTYIYTVSGAPTCPDADAEVVVTLQNQPDVTISPAGPFCESSISANLAAVTPGGTWSGTGITDPVNGVFDPATAGPGIHTITYTIGGFCGNTDTEDIQVIADEDATVNPAGPFCTTDPVYPMVALNGGGVWSTNAPGGSINAATGDFDPSIAGAGVWDVTYTIAGACGDAQTVQVTVVNQLDASIDPAGPFCLDDLGYAMQASVDQGGTWSANCVGCIDANTGVFNPGAAGVGTWDITYTHSGNCGDVQTIQVDVLPMADATINAVNPLCIGNAPINLTSTQAGGTWSGLGITDPVAGTFDPNVAGSGSHTITYTIGGQCGDAQSIQVVVNPPLSITAFSDQDICDGASANISAIAQGGDGAYTYIWTDPVGTQVGVGQFITVSPLVTTTYTVTVTDNCGTTSASADVTITVVPLPVIDFSVDNAAGCAPLTVNFTNNSIPQGTSCVWEFGDTYSSTDCGAVSHTYTEPGCYDVTLTVTANGCSNSATQTDMVCVYQPADAYFEHTPEVTNVYDPVYQFNNLSTDATTYFWDFDDGNTSTDINPQHTYAAVAGMYEVCLTAETPEGCNDTYCDSVEVEDVFIIYVPNAFTVDQDGLNEVFLPVVSGHVEESYELYVYDRWGQLVFESYHSNQGWDGSYRDRTDIAKSDVYVWKVRVKSAVNDEQKEFVGHVTLIR